MNTKEIEAALIKLNEKLLDNLNPHLYDLRSIEALKDEFAILCDAGACFGHGIKYNDAIMYNEGKKWLKALN